MDKCLYSKQHLYCLVPFAGIDSTLHFQCRHQEELFSSTYQNSGALAICLRLLLPQGPKNPICHFVKRQICKKA
jgi:hypothetical protein